MKTVAIRLFPWLVFIGAFLAVGVLLLGLPGPAHATTIVLVSNTGQSANATTTTVLNDHAQRFTTGKNTPGYVLTSIELDVGNAAGEGTLTVTVRREESGNPSDTVLHTLTNPANVGMGLQEFTAPADARLDANTSYFVHMTFAGDGTPPQWNTTNSDDEDAGANAEWSIDDERLLRTTGLTGAWSTSTDAIQVKVNGQNHAPAAPAALSATPGDGQVTLSWTDPDNDTITKYQYSTDGGTNFADISGSNATTTTYTVTVLSDDTNTALTNGTTYTLAVRAVNSGGDGAASTVTAVMVPAAPTGLSAAPGNAQAALSWHDPGNDTIEKYQVWRLALGKLASSDGEADDWFGYSVAVDSDTAVVGAWQDNYNATSTGSAFVFTKDSESDAWSQQAKLTASGGAAGDYFGFSVAVDGDVAVVGAFGHTSFTGAAYVFTRNSSGVWSQAAKLTASDGAAGDSFGWSVALDSDTVVVGASANLAGSTATGAAYVFTEPSTDNGWSDWDGLSAGEKAGLTATLTAADAAAGDAFGISVATDGDTAVVGAYQHDVNSNSDAGAAYVFTESSGWSQQAKLTPDDGASGDWFGRSVAVDGDTLVVGASQHDPIDPNSDLNSPSYLSNAGAAYVFTETSDLWSQQAKLTATDGAARDNFGTAVAVDGDTAVVGASGDDNTDTGINTGSAYIFIKPTTGWATSNETVKATASDGAALDYFGTSVAVDGDTAAVGAFAFDDIGGGLGSVYMLGIEDWKDISGSEATTTSHSATSLTNRVQYTFRVRAVNESGPGPASDSFSATPLAPKPAKPTGLSAKAGDGELMLSWDNPGDSTITRYQLSKVGPQDWLTASDGMAGDQLGVSVAVDGNTAVIGAYRDDDNGVDSGSAYVFTKDDEGNWDNGVKLTASDGAAGDQFGWSVAVDVAEDSTETVVVGAYRDEDDGDDVGDDKGSAYVFVKPNTGWATSTETARLTAFDRRKHDLFGVSVAVDGDTVVVGAPLKNAAGDDGELGSEDDLFAVGSAYVFTRDSAGVWSQGVKLPFFNGLPNDNFGFAVAVEDDTAFIGVIGADGFGRGGHGSVYIYSKPAAGWARALPNARLTASDRAPGDWFGYSVAVDGNTAVVGARLHNDSEAGAGSGAAYVFTMDSPAVWRQKAKLTASDGAAQDNFGFSVAVDGDNIVVGSWLDDDNGRNSGSAYVFTKPEFGWATSNETLKLTAPGEAPNDRFGHSVAVEGNQALVGAYKDDNESGMDAGSVDVLGITDWEDIAGSVATTTSSTVTGLTNGIEYTYQIRALNEGGASPASEGANATPLGKPVAPTGLSAAAGDSQVALSWNVPAASSTIAAIMKYEYSKDSGTSFDDIPGSVATTTAHMVTGLNNGTEYTFAVRAVNAIGDGPASEIAATPTSSTPGKPVWEEPDEGDTQVLLKWVDPHDSSIDKYEYQWTGNDGSSSWGEDGSSEDWIVVSRRVGRSIAHQYTATGLTNGVEYTFNIRARDDQDTGPGDPSDGLEATPMGTPPAAPTNLEAKAGDKAVQLIWDDPNDSSIDKYQYSTSGGATYTDIDPADVITDIEAGTKGLTVDELDNGGKLENGATYTFQIRAVDTVDPENAQDDEFGPKSNEASAKPLPMPPLRPDLKDPTEGNGWVRLDWGDPQDATITSYQVLHLLKTSTLAGAGHDKFGYSVAVDGDTAVIGAYQDDGKGDNSGAAYVFTRNSGVWDEGVKLTASDGEAYDNFGISVAVDGTANTVVVGASGDDGAGTDSGAAYVFVKPSGGWAGGNETAKLTASDGAALDYFGRSVSVDGNTALVGAYQDDEENDLADSGSAYIFVKPVGGWVATSTAAKLTASDGADDDWFGVSVALDGDTAIIGASGDDDRGIDSGSAYVFVKPFGTAWTATSTADSQADGRRRCGGRLLRIFRRGGR